MTHSEIDLKNKAQEYLGKEIKEFSLKGKGACNNAYYLQTTDGHQYIIKEEREDKETSEQNSLVVEGNLIKKLYALHFSIPLPQIAFVSEDPRMYCYEYLEGEMMRSVWDVLSEEEKISICRSLGHFHGELSQNVTKKFCEDAGIKINESKDLHPEVLEQYAELVHDESIPVEFRSLLKQAKEIYEGLLDQTRFHFVHNDAHHENILIKDKKISGVIDFGDAEWGEIGKEFSRYIRDYPDYFTYIVFGYEEKTGYKLSLDRLISGSCISGFVDVVEEYKKGGEARVAAENRIATYKKLLHLQ